jgi:hypothetical protein
MDPGKLSAKHGADVHGSDLALEGQATSISGPGLQQQCRVILPAEGTAQSLSAKQH